MCYLCDLEILGGGGVYERTMSLIGMTITDQCLKNSINFLPPCKNVLLTNNRKRSNRNYKTLCCKKKSIESFFNSYKKGKHFLNCSKTPSLSSLS